MAGFANCQFLILVMKFDEQLTMNLQFWTLQCFYGSFQSKVKV